MKNLTFNIICSLLLGMDRGPRRDELISNYWVMVAGMWSVPINLPFTRYRSSLRASARVRDMVRNLISEKRLQLENRAPSHRDLITCLLSIRDKANEELISEDEIIHNVMLVMVAGHDTSATVLTFMVRLLANNPAVYEDVLQEQEEIASRKAPGQLLTWEDLAAMKYTWKVALETLRMIPPVFGGFRRALKDIEYRGYLIPKGWQVFWVTSMTHMDGSMFPEPLKFNPARFNSQGSVPPYCFIPFGGGPRICPGYEFARIEILVSIHYLVTRFKWKLCCNDNFFSRDPMPVPTQGLPIQIVPKEHPIK